MSYLITEKARDDLDKIWHYIAQDNFSAANKVEDEFLKAFELIAENPEIGNLRNDLINKPLRFWLIHSYFIIYDPVSNPVKIIRILSNYRNIANYL